MWFSFSNRTKEGESGERVFVAKICEIGTRRLPLTFVIYYSASRSESQAKKAKKKNFRRKGEKFFDAAPQNATEWNDKKEKREPSTCEKPDGPRKSV
jgi:hypothetical protein